MSKNRDSIFPIILLSIAFAFCVFAFLDISGTLEDFKHEKIKAGQVWVKDSSDKKDPFEEKYFITNVVLDVKDRYVLYVRYQPGRSYFKRSSSESSFAHKAKILPFKLVPRESVETNFYRYMDLISTNVESTIKWEIQ